MESLLVDLLIFTSVSVVLVPLFKWLKLGAILAYLTAGLLIGPGVIGWIKDPEVILHFSELGVVFLLFLIGLELAPSRLWKMRGAIFGMGLLQVTLTGLVFAGVGLFFGLSPAVAYIAGFGLALSSTAFAMQILEEKRQLKTTHGQSSFAILMFQDIAVVPLLASLAFFSSGASGTSVTWTKMLYALAAVLGVVFVGRFLVRRLFRWVAETEIQEVFTAMSLLIVVGTGLLLQSVGLSMGLGAFLAGVLLADSEYRHELETNLLPFKGLLLGLFFIAVGMSLDLEILKSKPFLILGLGLGFMTVKMILLFVIGKLFKLPSESARNMAFTLPQGGEFAFVLFSTAFAQGLLSAEVQSILNASVILSMALTPFLFSLNQNYFRSFSEISERPFDEIDDGDTEIIVAGYGRFGQIVTRFLKAQEVSFTILEHSAAQVDVARKFGSKIFYGDASRFEVLERAGAKAAKYFVLAIDDPEKSVQAARVVVEKFPHLKIFARARNRQHAIDLMELGVTHIHRETFLTSLEVAKELMLHRGASELQVQNQLKRFRTHDDEVLKKQFDLRGDETKMISFTTQANKELEDLLKEDRRKELT